MCVCVWEKERESVCCNMCVLVCVRVFICVLCVCIGAWAPTRKCVHILSSTHTLCLTRMHTHQASTPSSLALVLLLAGVSPRKPTKRNQKIGIIQLFDQIPCSCSSQGFMWLRRVLYPKERKDERTPVQFLGYCVTKSGSLPQRKKEWKNSGPVSWVLCDQVGFSTPERK